jgi:signal transduction histidine kinase/CheY-like chemotaxis protein
MKFIKKQISLSWKFVLYSLIFASLICAYLSYLFIKEISIQNDKSFSRLSAELSFVKKNFDDSKKYTSLVLNGIVDKIAKNPQDKIYISEVLKSFRILHDSKMKDMLSISMFSWVDSSGKLVVSSDFGVLTKSVDLSNRDYLQLTRHHPNQLYLGKPVIGGVSEQYIIPAGVGLVGDGANYQGSVVVGFNIENIYQKFLKEKVMYDSSLQIIYNGEFGVIGNSIPVNRQYLEKIDLKNLDVQVLNYPSIFGKTEMLIYQNIANSPYGILVSFDNKNSFSSIKASYLVEFILIIFFFGILIYLLKSHFINPIIILSQEANLIGSGNSDIKIPKSNVLEINQLSKSILSIKNFIKKEQFLKQKIETADQAKISLLKSISHDLRNYISSISGLAEIIIEDYSAENLGDKNNKLSQTNKGQIVDFAKLIIKQSELMLGFAKDILNSDITELGIVKVDELEEVDIQEMINEMLILNKNFTKDNKVKVIASFKDDLPKLICDRRRFRQVIDNLLTNAIKYSKKDGEVTIGCELVEDKKNNQKQICISITDNGIGMTKKDIKAIFDGKGKEIDKSDLDKPIDSHGIGMQIVMQLIEVLGIKMEIESKKNKGTTVKLWFNLDGNNQLESNNNDELESKEKPSKTILIADDEEVNLMILERVLSDTKCKIISVRNGEEILEVLNKEKCDLIFMDIKMPKLDGIEVAKIIRSGKDLKYKKQKSIPIVAVSGSDDIESKNQILSAGINFSIGKPFIKKEVLDLVKKLIG